MSRSVLGSFEQHVLMAVHRLHGGAYAVPISDEIEHRSGQSVSLGAIYATLDRLEKKGFVSSKLGESTPERGGRPKRFYEVKAPGLLALSQAREAGQRLWGSSLPTGARA